jgi:hypothetical protein
MMQGLQDTHNVFQCDCPGGAMNTIRLKSVNRPRNKLVTQQSTIEGKLRVCFPISIFHLASLSK